TRRVSSALKPSTSVPLDRSLRQRLHSIEHQRVRLQVKRQTAGA
ncbi:hypothetical protein SAMN03159453_04460, partial [Pseudomonas sp. NFIX28]